MSSAVFPNDPTAVRDMKKMLEEYTANATRKLREVRDTARRNTPPPQPAIRQVPETRPPAHEEDEPPTRRMRVAR